jgi:pyruvate-formate lyase-activating enzyme
MQLQDQMLERELIANRKKHWVRAVTACNSRCLFCLDMDTPRNVFLPFEEVIAELQRGRDELDADKVIISGGEAALHPRFIDLILEAKKMGYDRVQTVTNGWKYADRDFYIRSRNAGLGEITFSLHGHTPKLHDHLTQHPNSFKRLIKGMVRAVRDPRGPIVNVDVVINKQNVAYLDKIVELCASLGVFEFDLLHIIPQSEAFRNRDVLFYDVREHMDVLHKVFRMNRHPRFVIWTNRFPISYLEGLEDLIQDPHKMIDEVNGRRFQIRRYIDTGKELDCRQPERCKHCFIEPFCTTLDRSIETQNTQKLDVWLTDDLSEIVTSKKLPFGARYHGISIIEHQQVHLLLSDIQKQHLEDKNICIDLKIEEKPEIFLEILQNNNFKNKLLLVIHDVWALNTWKNFVQNASDIFCTVEIHLNGDVAKWLLKNRDFLSKLLKKEPSIGKYIRIHQPHHEKLEQAVRRDVLKPQEFFAQLQIPIATSGLPPCVARHTKIVEPLERWGMHLFDPELGRLDSRALSRHHIKEHYLAKSERCKDCIVDKSCDGLHVNMIRHQGLKILHPLQKNSDINSWSSNAKIQLETLRPNYSRVLGGQPSQNPADSLDGFAKPEAPPEDPLAVIARKKEALQKRKREKRQQELQKIRSQFQSTK